MGAHRPLLFLSGLLLVLTAALPTAAEPYPTRPVRMVVAFSPGGFTDIVARIAAERLTQSLGQQVVVENRAGAGGIIGTELAARAAPDGYTVLMGGISTHAMNPWLYATLPYDPVKDFVAVARIASGPNLLVVHPSVKARSVDALIALAKANPGVLTFGSGGNGTSSHLAGEMFKTMAHVDLVHVPYKSTAPAAVDLLGGHLSLMFDTIPSALPQVRADKLRLLAVTSLQRNPGLPDVPTMAETLPGFEMGVWSGIFVPTGTPPEIVARLDQGAAALVALPDVAERFAGLGMSGAYAGPSAFAPFVAGELEKWGGVVKASGAKID